MTFPWILSALIIVLALFAVIAIVTKKKIKPMTYKNYFYMGIFWIVMGLLLGVAYPILAGHPPEEIVYMSGLTVLGLAFTIMGLANRDKWNEIVQKPIGKQSPLVIALVGLTLLVILEIAALVLV